jgi:hypothetical protein
VARSTPQGTPRVALTPRPGSSQKLPWGQEKVRRIPTTIVDEDGKTPLSPLIKQASPERPPFLGHAVRGALATVHGRSDEEEKTSTKNLLDETRVVVDSDALRKT